MPEGEELERDLKAIFTDSEVVESLERAVDDFEHGRGTVRNFGEMPYRINC